MARIPYSGAEGLTPPGTISVPNDYQSVRANPAAFGAATAQATEGFGQGLERTGGALMNTALVQRQFEDTAAVTDALNTMQEQARSIQFGDPNNPQDVGFYGTKGKDALTAYTGAAQRVSDLRDDLKASLGDPRQQALFDRQSRRLAGSVLDTMARHRQQELTAYGVQTQKAALNNALTDAGLAYNDDEAFTSHLADAVRSKQQADLASGAPEEVVRGNARGVISTAWQERIQRLAADDPIAADGMLRKNLDKLDPDTQTKLIERVGRMAEDRKVDDGLAFIEGRSNGPRNGSGSLSRQDFLSTFGPEAKRIAPQIGVAPEVILAHWGQETGWGSHLHDNNVGNIQAGAGFIGSTTTRGDTDAAGKPYQTKFRAYNTPAQAADDYAALLSSSRYAGARGAGADALKFGQGLKDGGYMENPNGARDIAAAAKGLSLPDDAPKRQPGAPYAIPSKEDVLTKADQISQGWSIRAQDQLRSKALAWRNEQDSLLTGQRAALGKELGNTVAALQDGREVQPIDETRIRSLYPPEQAEPILEQQRTAEATGFVTRAMRFASPADRQQMLNDAMEGTGSVGRIVLGRQAGALPLNDAGEIDTTENYKMRRQAAGIVQERDKALQQQLAADPALYVSQSPAVQPVMQAAQQPNATPDQRAAAVTASLAEQGRMGVPEAKRMALPAAQAAADVHALQSVDPAKADMGLALQQKAAAYGDAWPQVFASYVHAGLSPEYQALAIMDRPDQTGDRADMQRALAFQAEKGGLKQLKEAVGDATAKEIDMGVDDKMADFKASVVNDANAVRMYDTFRDSVKSLAYYKAMKGDSNALENAYQGVIGKRYDFDGTMRVPKGQLSDVRTATRAAVAGLKPEDMPVLADSTPGLADSDKQAQFLASVKSRGIWVPTADDGGLQLTVLGHNGTPISVAVQGKPVTVRFDQLNKPKLPMAEADIAPQPWTAP